MKKERVLSYITAQKLSPADLNNISGAGMTSYFTASGTYQQPGGPEGFMDFQVDL